MLTLQNVAGGYNGHKIVKDLSFQVHEGEFFGILGPNGSGKTTLLKMISGTLPLIEGSIHLKDQLLSTYSPKELATIIAVLPQLTGESFSYTVEEVVVLGRYAHQKGLFQSMSSEDERIIEEAMAQTGILSFRHKSLMELSGGAAAGFSCSGTCSAAKSFIIR